MGDPTLRTVGGDCEWALSYNSYALMLASVDAGWTRAPFSSSGTDGNPSLREFSNALADLSRSALTYRDQVSANYTKWCAANNAEPSAPIDSRLFATQPWIPFGHADGLTLTLVDDLDAAQTIIEHYSKTVEEVTVAYCPEMGNYRRSWRNGISDQLTLDSNLEATLKPLLKTPLVDPIEMFENDSSSGGLLPLRFKQVEGGRPLLLFTRLRLGPILAVSRILAMQQLIYHGLARRMGRAWVELFRDKKSADRLYREEDVTATRISFLDLQEEEEIGVVFWTPNLSVATSMMVAAQSLTINDLTTVSPDRMSQIFHSKVYREFQDWHLREHGGNSKAQTFEEMIGGNHAFRWSRSTAAFSWNALYEAVNADRGILPHDPLVPGPDEKAPEPTSTLAAVNGFIGIRTSVGISPGHQRAVDDFLAKTYPGVPNVLLPPSRAFTIWTHPSLQPGSGPEKYISPEPSVFHYHTLGVQDRTIAWGCEGGIDNALPVSVERYIRICAHLLIALAEEFSNDEPVNRHITGWSSQLSVPVPRTGVVSPPLGNGVSYKDWYHPPIDHTRHRAIIHDLLGRVQKIRVSLKTNENPDHELAFLEPRFIRKKTRECGLPVTLRRSLMYLYEDFASILTNINSFDIVLDFLEVLATLNRALTRVLPDQLKKSDHPDLYTPRASIEVSEQLAQILDAINHTFELRLRRVYPESPLRDWSLDFRSSLQQTVLGSQAVLKCALAVLRKDVLGAPSDQEPDENGREMKARETLGVILRLRFGIGMRGHLLRDLSGLANATSSERKEGTRLAVFEADFPLLSHIPGYVEVYHEAFHLIYEELRDEEVAYQIKGGDNQAEMLSEVFVHLLKFLFLFDGDCTLTLKEHLMAYSISPNGDGGEVAVLRRRFTKNFFAACMPILVAIKAGESDLSNPLDAVSLTDVTINPKKLWSLKETSEFMWENLWRVRSCFPDFDWLFPRAGEFAVPDTFEEEISAAYIQCYEAIGDSWRAARVIYSAHVRRLCNEYHSKPNRPTDTAEHLAGLEDDDDEKLIPTDVADTYRRMVGAADRAILKAWGDGNEVGFEPVVGIDLANPDFPGECIDANLLIRRTLYRYLKIVRFPESGDDSERLHLDRKFGRYVDDEGDEQFEESGAIVFSKGQKYSKLLIDRTAVHPFCCVPDERRKMLGRQIAVLKTVWDIASRNRARRLRTLLRIVRNHPAEAPPEPGP